jgi:flagellar biosynthesis/type III secretory pathway ATPase
MNPKITTVIDALAIDAYFRERDKDVVLVQDELTKWRLAREIIVVHAGMRLMQIYGGDVTP